MNSIFEFTLKDKKLNTFFKHCDSVLQQSDTALFKVSKRGIFVRVTDLEGFCSCETSIGVKGDPSFKLTQECDAKILLVSLVNELKKAVRLKHTIVLLMREDHQLIIRDQTETVIESVEHRVRDFFVLSLRVFLLKSENSMQFKMINSEFSQMVTRATILSGVSGRIASFCAEPILDHPNRTKLVFGVESNGACKGTLSVDATTTSDTATILVVPKSRVFIYYLLTYLKRAIHILHSQYEYVMVTVSERGMMLHTEPRDGVRTIIAISAICDVDKLHESCS
jgi:hypothetical protein